jgi:hypothetical protein
MISNQAVCTREELDAIIARAGPHRTVEFRFERQGGRKLACVGASIPALRHKPKTEAQRP